MRASWSTRDDHHLDLLAELHELVQVVHALPRELGDGDEAVGPAEIDERPERLDALDDALADLPFLDRRPELLGLLLPLALQQRPAADDQVPLLGLSSTTCTLSRWLTNWSRSSTRYRSSWLAGMNP